MFSGCTNLATIKGLDHVTDIGSGAFSSTALTSVIIPKDVKSIGESTFLGCTKLENIKFEEGTQLGEIGASAFYECSVLERIDIPASVTAIGASAFASSGLTSIEIPSGVTAIAESTFSACASLSEVTLPNTVTSIGASTFSGCSALEQIDIPASVTTIGASAFASSSLTALTIPASVTNIGDSAFSSCSDLSTITCNGTTAPALGGTDVFDTCDVLETIYIPEGSEESYKKNNWPEDKLRVLDRTAPILSDGEVIRTNVTAATVMFTSSEAGRYYYAIVDSGASAPTICTNTEGAECVIGENTIALTDLTAGEKTIYIVAKDASGNVSEKLSLTIPGFYTLTVALNGGSGSTTGGDYLPGTSIAIDAGSREGYRFDCWTSSSGGSFADASSASTVFTMPAADTTITAHWRYNGGGGGSVATDYYRLSFDTNGGSEIASIRRAEYTIVDLSAFVPTREGYTFAGWFADEALTQLITEIRLTSNRTVYAGWVKMTPVLPFVDVSEDDWFYDPVVWAYNEDLMTGTSATTFEPNTSTTRGMIVSILHRLEDAPVVNHLMTFDDVADDDWYAEAVRWAASENIVAGYSDTAFGPNDPITREQLAAILYNYAEWKGMDVSARADLSRYSDQPSAWANDVMEWAVAEGLISGTSATNLDPQGTATRAQVAAILQRFLEN